MPTQGWATTSAMVPQVRRVVSAFSAANPS